MGHSSRRQFLGGASAALLAAGLPGGRVLARPGQGLLRFVFVFAQGGWDPTRVFAAQFDNPNVDMEPDAGLAQAGGIPFVDHADRPAVGSFLSRWHANTVVFNGLLVRSLAHEVCTRIAMTGSPSGLRSDWAALLADAERSEFLLPNLVISAPSYPGERGVSVARTGGNGQLGGLLSGDLRDWSDQGQGGPNRPAEAQIDSFLARRVEARALASRSAPERALLDDLVTATEQAAALKGHQHNIDFSLAGGVSAVSELTRQVFSEGISRCVSIGFGNGGWDTHAKNDPEQSTLWGGLFEALGTIMSGLAEAPGTWASSLADETVLVVLSEMGRTPLLNGFQGKDHHPYTSCMVVGPGLDGSRVVGGFDTYFGGRRVDPRTAEISDSGVDLSAEHLGATLLALADLDTEALLPGVDPLLGILS